MKKTLFLLAALFCATGAFAEQICVGGVCYLSEEAARAAGVSQFEIDAAKAEHAAAGQDAVPAAETPPAPDVKQPAVVNPGGSGARLAMGFMKPKELIAFLRDEAAGVDLESHSLIVILLLVLMGGLAANLTPCVLPLVPVNLILVGKGWKRGAAYGLGITCAYGALGCAAAFGGLAFGTIQSNPWFINDYLPQRPPFGTKPHRRRRICRNTHYQGAVQQRALRTTQETDRFHLR